MSIIKRLSTTLFSRLDQVVGEIENHDALAEAAIGEQRKKIAAAKLQLARLQGHERRMQEQVDQLTEEAARWQSRALKAAAEDETRALACMQRRKQLTEQVERHKAARDEYAATAARMSADVSRAENELGALSQKHALLRARQSSSEALGATGRNNVPKLDELETTFDRWELRITQEEILNDTLEPIDTLEQQYRSEEEAEALRNELQALLAGERSDER